MRPSWLTTKHQTHGRHQTWTDRRRRSPMRNTVDTSLNVCICTLFHFTWKCFFFVQNETVKHICTNNQTMWKKSYERNKPTYIKQEGTTLKSHAVCCKSVHVSVTVLHMFYTEACNPETSRLNVCGSSLP